jgi:hypothetical protein
MCNDGAGAQDRDLQRLYNGCWKDFFLWVYRAYDMTDDSWEPTGKFDACNISLPFAKMVNSVFLFPYALTDVIGGCRQWHSSEGYTSLSRAASNRFHGPFYLQFTRYLGSRPAHAEIGRTAARDRTVMHCPLFDVGHKHDTPSFRASVLIHEARHHWQYEHDFDGAHQERDGKEVDHFYRHTAEAYPCGHRGPHASAVRGERRPRTEVQESAEVPDRRAETVLRSALPPVPAVAAARHTNCFDR